jgi:hypothetical protein
MQSLVRVVAERDLERAGRGEARVARTALRASLDALVIVGECEPGGVRRRSVPLIHVRGPGDLRAHWFLACRTVGLVATPRCLPEQLAAVRRWLEALL